MSDNLSGMWSRLANASTRLMAALDKGTSWTTGQLMTLLVGKCKSWWPPADPPLESKLMQSSVQAARVLVTLGLLDAWMQDLKGCWQLVL